MKLGSPGAPRNLQIEDLSKHKVILTWEKPDFDGGSPVTGYYLEKRQSYSTRWTRVNRSPLTTLMHTVKDLTEDEEYEFRVLAENEAGQSKPSESTGVFRARDPYTTPGRLDAPDVVINGEDAVVSWRMPRDDGHSPITKYIVEMKAKNQTKWKPAGQIDKAKLTTLTIPKLEPETEYEFRVTAENKAGCGEPSQPSVPVKYGQYVICLLSYLYTYFKVIALHTYAFAL